MKGLIEIYIIVASEMNTIYFFLKNICWEKRKYKLFLKEYKIKGSNKNTLQSGRDLKKRQKLHNNLNF